MSFQLSLEISLHFKFEKYLKDFSNLIFYICLSKKIIDFLSFIEKSNFLKIYLF